MGPSYPFFPAWGGERWGGGLNLGMVNELNCVLEGGRGWVDGISLILPLILNLSPGQK